MTNYYKFPDSYLRVSDPVYIAAARERKKKIIWGISSIIMVIKFRRIRKELFGMCQPGQSKPWKRVAVSSTGWGVCLPVSGFLGEHLLWVVLLV